MNNRIVVQLNLLGPYIKRDDIQKILEQGHLQGTVFVAQKEMLEVFFGFPLNILSKEILERYIDATTEDSHISIFPHTKEIFERLLKPLISVKKNYCFGDYTAAIASCGIVGEMLAILIWKINEVRLKGNIITEDEEKGLFDRPFEKLNQDRRLRILRTFGFINEDQYKNFVYIKDARRPYLHLWTAVIRNEKKDALNTLKKSLQVFKEITGIGLATAGTVKINPLLLKLFKNVDAEYKVDSAT